MSTNATGPLSWVTLVLGGVIVGVVAVIYHSAFWPFGIAAVVTMILTLVVGLRLIARTRWPALLGVVTVFTVVVVLSGSDDQGSVLVMGDATGLSFLGLIVMAATVALAWPKFSDRPASYDRDAGVSERTLPQ